MVDDFSSKFLQLRFISLEVASVNYEYNKFTATFYWFLYLFQLPQQENFYDCGLFLLHYVERFLKEAPINFNPAKITKFSNFVSHFPLSSYLNVTWFHFALSMILYFKQHYC